jgi:hypothetical protein
MTVEKIEKAYGLWSTLEKADKISKENAKGRITLSTLGKCNFF